MVRVQQTPLNSNINPIVGKLDVLRPRTISYLTNRMRLVGNADVIAFHTLKFEKNKNLIYNIYTRSGELRTFFLSFLSDSPDRSGKYTKALF